MKHGSYVTYKDFRCRCPLCTEANSRWQKGYLLRRIANGGAPLSPGVAVCRDRLRELRRAGYPLTFLQEKTGVDDSTLRAICNGHRTRVVLATFHAIETTWREYHDFPGSSRRATTWASKLDWPAPPPPTPDRIDEDYVDTVLVERALDGQRVTLTRAESAEAWTRLEAKGLPAKEIARRLHTTEKTVERWRSGENRPSTSRARKRSA